MQQGRHHRATGRGVQTAIGLGGAVGQSAVDIDGLGAVLLHHTHNTGVLGHGAVEERLVVGAIVVVVASTLRVLLAHTDDRQRLVLVSVLVHVVIVVAVGVGVGAV